RNDARGHAGGGLEAGLSSRSRRSRRDAAPGVVGQRRAVGGHIFPLRGKNGTYQWFLSRALPLRDASGRVVRWLGTNTDVSEQRATEEALRRGALHDALTDLPNRAYFLERVSHALARRRRDPHYRFAVLLLDCDGFKAVNDRLGHAAGDRLLREIAGRLQASVRPGDLVARLGG